MTAYDELVKAALVAYDTGPQEPEVDLFMDGIKAVLRVLPKAEGVRAKVAEALCHGKPPCRTCQHAGDLFLAALAALPDETPFVDPSWLHRDDYVCPNCHGLNGTHSGMDECPPDPPHVTRLVLNKRGAMRSGGNDG